TDSEALAEIHRRAGREALSGVPPRRREIQRTQKELQENMGKQHWEFSSTAAQFDGQRLVREASEAGAVVLTVTRGNKALQFIRADVYMRRVDAGLQPNGPEGVLEVVG